MKGMVVALAMVAAPIAAQEAPAGDTRPLLWHGLRAGMTKAEVKAILPVNTVPLTEGCAITADPVFEDKKLDRIEMASSSADLPGKRCATQVEQTMQAKYGEPDKTQTKLERQGGGDCGNPYASGLMGALAKMCKASGAEEVTYSKRFYSLWKRPGMEVTFMRDTDGNVWGAMYRVVVVADTKAMQDKF